MELITLTTAATAITTIFCAKVVEKQGENLGQLLSDQTQNLVTKLVARLQGKSDKVAGLLYLKKEDFINIELIFSRQQELMSLKNVLEQKKLSSKL